MAGNDIRARLLKQRGVLASQKVKLSFGEVEVRELEEDRMDVIRDIAKREEGDEKAFMRLSVAESVYVDGDLLINKEFMDAAKEYNKNVLVKEIFKQGDTIKAFEALMHLMGYGNADDEVEELKN